MKNTKEKKTSFAKDVDFASASFVFFERDLKNFP